MPQLPLAVTVGFSGPCRWFSEKESPGRDAAAFQEAAKTWLADRLGGLPAELGLADHFFLTGISQIAVGGDHAFTEACQQLGIPQRISLPQPSDVFLTAIGSNGPDFTENEKKKALSLLASPHIIQETVASGAATRDERFEETNIELIRQSDVIIAMLKPTGGTWTRDLVKRAKRWGIPVLEVAVSIQNGKPSFSGKWNGEDEKLTDTFKAPTVPDVLANVTLDDNSPIPHSIPAKNAYFTKVKNHCSDESSRHNKFFQDSAWRIISMHFYASACAVLSLVLLYPYFISGAYYPTLAVILALEIIFLIRGFRRHRIHHKKEAGALWAMNRLLTEVARSVLAFGQYHVGFDHLWQLNLPDESRHLLRTMEILQLRETRLQTCTDWKDCRTAYLQKRLIGQSPDFKTRRKEKNAQINYYRSEFTSAKKKYHFAHKFFTFASLAAIAATFLKFSLVAMICCNDHFHPDVFKAILGFLGVILPVVAVAALSLAAAKDLEARSHTFQEMRHFLIHQAKLLKNAASEREFAKLLHETESRLLGETVTWFSRRTFTGIA